MYFDLFLTYSYYSATILTLASGGERSCNRVSRPQYHERGQLDKRVCSVCGCGSEWMVEIVSESTNRSASYCGCSLICPSMQSIAHIFIYSFPTYDDILYGVTSGRSSSYCVYYIICTSYFVYCFPHATTFSTVSLP
jgi:hypothetical protein